MAHHSLALGFVILSLIALANSYTDCYSYYGNSYTCGDDYYCCDETECCAYDYDYSIWGMWYFWLIVICVLSIISSCIGCCVRAARRREMARYQRITAVRPTSYGTHVVTVSNTVTPAQGYVPPPGYSAATVQPPAGAAPPYSAKNAPPPPAYQ